jgi:rifampicin phosphotransferase
VNLILPYLDSVTPLSCFFEQLKDLSVLKESDNDPQRVYDRGVERRGKTYKQLLALLPRSKRKKFKKYYTILTYFAAYRELPKYYSIKWLGLIRKHAEQYGRKWASEGRLNQWDQIFDLNISDIKQAISDNNLDIMQRASSNTGFLKEIAKTRNFPRLIDSRGRILHLPTNIDNDQLLVGEPISPGIVRGIVRVLTSPTGEKLQPGEILVTKATDPGWTPLFLSAGGIVLEVGGLLQHGALVAREYCKPCVAGIEHIASILETGQEIEIDGSNGTIQILHAEK